MDDHSLVCSLLGCADEAAPHLHEVERDFRGLVGGVVWWGILVTPRTPYSILPHFGPPLLSCTPELHIAFCPVFCPPTFSRPHIQK